MNDKRYTLLLLASGLSKRFKSDKLLCEFAGVPLLNHSAKLYRHRNNVDRYSVVGTIQNERIQVLTEMDWQLIMNPVPEKGMSHSIKLGVEQAIKGRSHILLIALADMPRIKDYHLDQLCDLVDQGAKVAISKSDQRLVPPAAFHRDTWHHLSGLSGDSGAKQIIEGMLGVETLEMDRRDLLDVNTTADLERLRDLNDQH